MIQSNVTTTFINLTNQLIQIIQRPSPPGSGSCAINLKQKIIFINPFMCYYKVLSFKHNELSFEGGGDRPLADLKQLIDYIYMSSSHLIVLLM